MVWPKTFNRGSANTTSERREFCLLNLPAPPGLNASYKIVRLHSKRTGKTFSSLAKTDAALHWEETCAERLRGEMRRQHVEPLHTLEKRQGELVLVPSTDSPWYITVYYRLVTSRADADAPVKLLTDAAIEQALGVNDAWVGSPLMTKRLAEKRGETSAKGTKLVEASYMHAVFILDPLSHAGEFNERSIDRENDLLAMIGATSTLPDSSTIKNERSV